MRARDAQGNVIAQDHVELVTSGRWMVPTFAIVALLGFAGAALTTSVVGGWSAIALIVLSAIVGLIAILSLGFWLWGRYLGLPWHFTK